MTWAADNRSTSQCAGAGDPQMVFNRKDSFFLDLSGDSAQTPVTVAPVKEPAAPSKAPSSAPKAQVAIAVAPADATAAVATEEAPAAASASTASVLTTAEEIAAQLAADQANRPPASNATFAPDNLTPGAFIPRRRRGGANLAGFRTMAASMFRN